MSNLPKTSQFKKYGVAILGSSLIASSALVIGPSQLALAASPAVAPAAVLLPAAQASAVAQADDEAGVLIARVQRDSPAAKAGLRRGDILLKVNDVDVNEPQDIVDVLAKAKAGDNISLSIKRGDAEQTLKATATDRNGKAYLGFTPVGQSFMPQPMNPDQTQPFPRMPGMPGTRGGMQAMPMMGSSIVVSVTKDSPADKAGLKANDVIESYNGTKLDQGKSSLAELVAANKPGDVVTLTVQTPPAKDTHEVKVTLGENPDKKGAAYLGITYRPNRMMVFSDQGQGQGGVLEMKPGAIVAQVQADGPAAKAGVENNDLITEFGGKAISDTQSLIAAVATYKPGDVVKLKVERNGETKELSVTLGKKSDDATKAFLGVSLGGPIRFRMDKNGMTMPFDLGELPNLDDLFKNMPKPSQAPQSSDQSNS